MLKLHTVERNWQTLLEALDSIGEHLRDNFDHYDKVFRRCDRYFMQKHGRKADTLHDVIVILNCRGQARAQVFLHDTDFDSLVTLLNQFYRLREVHNAITSEILKPIYRYYYLYFSQDKRHERLLETVINAANTAKIFINSVQEEGDQRRFAPKPFGKEEVKPHRKVWHVLSFLENSLLGLRPILEQLEDWQLQHRQHLDGQEIDFLQPLLSYRYARVEAKSSAAEDEDRGTLRGRRFGRQRKQQPQDEPKRWEDQLRVHGEPIKAAPTFPKRYGGMVNNYLSAREDHQLQQRVDSYWAQEAALDEWRRRPVVHQQERPQQQQHQPLLAIAAAPPSSSSRFQDAASGRYLEQIVIVAPTGQPPATSYRTDPAIVESTRRGPSVFITEESEPGDSGGGTPRLAAGAVQGVGLGGTAAAAGTRFPPLGQPLPRVTADAPVRAVRGFDPDTYLEELRSTDSKLQVVTAALKQQEVESADLLAKMSGAGRGGGGGKGEGAQQQQQQNSFDWLQVLRQEKEASIHSLRQRIDLLNFQKKLILSRLQAPLFTY